MSQVYKPAGTTDNIGDLLSTISISDLFNLVKQYDPEFKPKPVNEALINKADGTPKVFYHGTNENFTEFSPDEFAPREGSFFFAENREDAAAYGNNIFEVYLRGENLADYDNQPSEFYQLRDKLKQVEYLKEQGYDGWYADMDSEGWGEVSVFSPSQIKSAKNGGNIGTFSEAENDIQYSLPQEVEEEYEGHRQKALELFGTTTDFRVTGFTMPDGKTLKLSKYGVLGTQHRLIEAVYDDLKGDKAINQFIQE